MYATIEEVKIEADYFIQSRLDSVRIEIINYLHSMLPYVDRSIYEEARLFISRRQVETMSIRDDIDVMKILASRISTGNTSEHQSTEHESEHEEEAEESEEAEAEESEEPEAEAEESEEPEAEAEESEEPEVESEESEEPEAEAEESEESEEPEAEAEESEEPEVESDKSEESEEPEVEADKSKEPKKTKSRKPEIGEHEIPSHVKQTIASMRLKLQKTLEREIPSLTIEEVRITVPQNNKPSYLNAILTTTKEVKPVVITTPLSKPIVNEDSVKLFGSNSSSSISEQLKPLEARIQSRPLNGTVFRTFDGSRIEIPILKPYQINPFSDIIANRYNLDPSFNDFKTTIANTRLKATFEAIKYLNISQVMIDSILSCL